MLKKERQDRILEIVREKQYCTVGFLAQTLYVAPITIRRDLAHMEQEGLLRRCHGGAAMEEHLNREVPLALRDRENSSAKDSIARKAVKLLGSGDTVFMDASSTVAHMADYITPEQELTIVTNSLHLMEKLKGRHIRCYLTGGMLLENSNALVGRVAEQTVRELYADVCFFSSQGVTEDGVITDFSEEETHLRKLMIQNAGKSVFLFDRSKVGKRLLFRLCRVEDLSSFICEDDSFGFSEKNC